MLEKEEHIVGNINEDNPDKKTNKMIRWFRFNEVSTSPLRPPSSLPNDQHIIEGQKHQETLYSLTKIDQTTEVEISTSVV